MSDNFNITVIFGGEGHGVTIEELKVVAEDLGKEYPVPHCIDNYNILVYRDGISDLHLQLVLDDLAEKLNSTDWLSHQNDLLVDEGNWKWVDVAYGRYTTNNCNIDAWMVTA